MKKIKVLLVAVCFVLIFALVGCGDKTALSSSEFETISENYGCTITNAKGQYTSEDHIKNATIAESPAGWQVEFYVFDDEGHATSAFNKAQTEFETYIGNSKSESSVTAGNHCSYALTSSGYFMKVSRIDNTLLYVQVQDTYKDDVKELLEELDY